MSDPALNFPEDVKKFVDDAIRNKTGRIQVNPGFPQNPTARDSSEFFNLRRACATTTVGVVPPTMDPGKVCNLVLVKATEAARQGKPISDPTHLLSLHAFIMEDKGYTKGADSNRTTEAAATMGAQVYNQHAHGNLSKAPKEPFSISDKRFLPAGSSKPVGFNNFKGMAFDAGFTNATNHFLKHGVISLDTASAPSVGPERLQELSAACRVGNPNVTYTECSAAGNALSDKITDSLRPASKAR